MDAPANVPDPARTPETNLHRNGLPALEDYPETLPGVPQHIVDSLRQSVLDIREGRTADAWTTAAQMRAKIDAYIEAKRLQEVLPEPASVSDR